jgi:hypothetical protein
MMLRNLIGYLAIIDFVSDPFSSEMGKHIIVSNPYVLTAYLLLKLHNFILVGMLARAVPYFVAVMPFLLE